MTKHFPLPLPPGTDSYQFVNLGATDYTAPAVSFTNGVNLTNDDGFGTPSVLSFSFWFRMASYTAGGADFNFFQFQNHDDSDASGVGFVGTEDEPALGPGPFFAYFVDPTDAYNINGVYYTPLYNNQWHHILYVLDGTQGTYTFYLDDQFIPTPPQADFSYWPTPPMTFDLQGLMTLPFFGNATGQDFDIADVWIAPGVSLLDDNGQIPVATRRQFISDTGQPVDPSGFPSSAILFSGDHTTFGTNQGTGGDFTLTGSLTDATSSPSSTGFVTFPIHGGTYTYALATEAVSLVVHFQGQAPDGSWHDWGSAGQAQTSRFYAGPGPLRFLIQTTDAPISLAFSRCPNVLADGNNPNVMGAGTQFGFIALEGVNEFIALEDGDLMELE